MREAEQNHQWTENRRFDEAATYRLLNGNQEIDELDDVQLCYNSFTRGTRTKDFHHKE